MDLKEGGYSPFYEEGSNLIVGSCIVLKNNKGKFESLEMRNHDDEKMQFNNEELTCS